MNCSIHQPNGDKIKEDNVGGACCTYGKGEKFQLDDLKGTDYLVDLSTDKRIILIS
jgi:hypothetical protein